MTNHFTDFDQLGLKMNTMVRISVRIDDDYEYYVRCMENCIEKMLNFLQHNLVGSVEIPAN